MIVHIFWLCIFCTALRSRPLEEALVIMAESVENLAWQLSPITCIESWKITDININHYAPINLEQLTPQPTSFSERIIQPYTTGMKTYIVSVAKQAGTLCGYHAVKNILWLLSAYMAATPHDAREWLRRMTLSTSYQPFQYRMGIKCAATDTDIEDFLFALSQEAVPHQDLLAHESVLNALKNDRHSIMSMHLNTGTRAATKPFISIGYKTGFDSAVEDFRRKSPALFPAIVYATEDPHPNAASAHFVAILGINDGVKQALFLCDSLSSGQGYGIPLYMEYISEALFAKK
jgi:hypothetical protein